MVPAGGPPLTALRRRAVAAFLVAATLVWWHVHRDGLFYVVGLDEPASSLLGPLLPALSAGLAIALVFSITDAAAGPIAGLVAAVVVLALPGFLPLHRESLSGPPLLALTLMMLGLMLQAPRFSVAYGTLAAVAAIHVDPAGLGLPLAAVAWAIVVRRSAANGTWVRAALAIVPLVVVLGGVPWTGDAWPAGEVLGWRGGLDEGLQAAGTIVGDQLAPTLDVGALRWFAIADMTLLLLAVLVLAWRWAVTAGQAATMVRRHSLASIVVASSLAIGLLLRWLLLPGSPRPGMPGVLPIVVLLAGASVVAVATQWPRWPRWGRLFAVLLLLGWFQAAVRA